MVEVCKSTSRLLLGRTQDRPFGIDDDDIGSSFDWRNCDNGIGGSDASQVFLDWNGVDVLGGKVDVSWLHLHHSDEGRKHTISRPVRAWRTTIAPSLEVTMFA